MTRHQGFLFLACAVAVVLIYTGFGGADLIFDSRVAISANSAVAIDGTQLDDWRTASLSSDSGPLRRPIAMFTLAAQHALAGEFAPRQLRFFNALLHIGIGMLVYLFLRDFLRVAPHLRRYHDGAATVAGLAALLWLVHPLHLSTIMYVVQRMAQFATLFVLLGLWIYVRFRCRWAERWPTGGELLGAGLWLLLALVLAVLSKENGALLLWLLVVVEFVGFRGQLAGARRPWLNHLSWIVLLAPAVMLAGLASLEDGWIAAGFSARDFSLDERMMTQLRVLWFYVGLIAVPRVSAMGLHHDDIALSVGWFDPVTTLVALVGWLLLIGAAIGLRHRWPLLLFAVLFFLVAHSLESTVLALELVYEHRNYLASVGPLCLAAAAILALGHRLQRVPLLAAGSVLVLLALLVQRALPWTHELSLAASFAQRHPASARSNYHYANALLRHAEAGELPDAAAAMAVSRDYYLRMYALKPDSMVATASLMYLDGRYFPALPDRVDWFSELESQLDGVVLQAEDLNAIPLLTDCLLLGYCAADKAAVLAVYSRLEQMPRGFAIASLNKARLLEEAYDDPAAAMQVLRDLVQSQPQYLAARAALMRMSLDSGDTGSTLELARELIASDRRRLSVGDAAVMFRAPEQADSGEAVLR